MNGKTATNAGWSYPNPSPGYEAIKDHLALYAHLVDAAYVDDEQVQPPEWEWIGGWVTPEVVGPFITREQAQAEH